MPKTVNSSNVNDLNDILVGEKNHYQIGKQIGSGGNGKVFDAVVIDDELHIPLASDGYVIKVLSADKNQAKRRQRFSNEIKAVMSFPDDISGIIPIFDCNRIDDASNSKNWYLMPKAEQLDLYANDEDLAKLRQIRSLCESISKLHEFGYAHRDIKPANILKYGGEICLSDFGLIWDNSETSRLTDTGEFLGPYDIRPPEFEGGAQRIENFDYRVSDVYLFAKTMWIILTKYRHGFRGEYNRGDASIVFDRHKLQLGETLEPLHLLMEQATKHNYSERISMRECINLIDSQIEICEKTMPLEIIDKMKYDERFGFAKVMETADDMVFRENEKIFDILRQFQGASELIVYNQIKTISLGILKNIRRYSDDLFVISLKGVRKRTVILSVSSLVISSNNLCKCQLQKIDVNETGLYRRVTDIADIDIMSNETIALDCSIEIKIACPFHA